MSFLNLPINRICYISFLLLACYFLPPVKGILAQEDSANTIDKGAVPAVLIPQHEATFSSTMPGKVVLLNFQEGDTFKKDDILYGFDCTSIKASTKERAAAKNAAWAKYSANKELSKLKSVSDLELKVSLYEYQRTEASLEIMKDQESQCSLKAPFSGRVIEQKVNLHESVQENQEIISVISTERLLARMLIPSKWLSWLQIGTELKISVHEYGSEHGAKVIRIGGAVDEVSQSIMVIAELSEDASKLLPGMSGVAYFQPPENPLP